MLIRLQYEHIDSAKPMEVKISLGEENGHWAARILGSEQKADLRAPVFYGETPEQAERQLRKVFEKDHDLIGRFEGDE